MEALRRCLVREELGVPAVQREETRQLAVMELVVVELVGVQ